MRGVAAAACGGRGQPASWCNTRNKEALNLSVATRPTPHPTVTLYWQHISPAPMCGEATGELVQKPGRGRGHHVGGGAAPSPSPPPPPCWTLRFHADCDQSIAFSQRGCAGANRGERSAAQCRSAGSNSPSLLQIE